MDPSTIRRRIRVALAERDMTLKEAAAKAGVPYSTASKFVAGQRPPRRDQLARLARAIIDHEAGDR